MVSKLKRVALREVWPHEPAFTKWLELNVDVLNEVLNLNLASPERERAVGGFNVDLVAEDVSGDLVVIENQLERSDHDHLGKLLTYLTSVQAKAAIWIVADPRPEHVGAVSWLNESSSADFYLVKVEAIQIEDSPAAPLLTLIVGPSEEGRTVGQTKKELAERHIIRQQFWTGLLAAARSRTKLHSAISPSNQGWIGTGAGRSGMSYNYVITEHDSRVELYVDLGRDSDETNKAIFDQLETHREAVEATFGEPLTWERLDGRRACRIRKDLAGGGYRDEESWSNIQERLVNAMIRFEKALGPQIAKLRF